MIDLMLKNTLRGREDADQVPKLTMYQHVPPTNARFDFNKAAIHMMQIRNTGQERVCLAYSPTTGQFFIHITDEIQAEKFQTSSRISSAKYPTRFSSVPIHKQIAAKLGNIDITFRIDRGPVISLQGENHQMYSLTPIEDIPSSSWDAEGIVEPEISVLEPNEVDAQAFQANQEEPSIFDLDDDLSIQQIADQADVQELEDWA